MASAVERGSSDNQTSSNRPSIRSFQKDKVIYSVVVQPNMFHGDICFKNIMLSLVLLKIHN